MYFVSTLKTPTVFQTTNFQLHEKKYFNEVYVTIFVYFAFHDHGFFLEKPKHAAANYTARHIKRSCDCPYFSIYCVYIPQQAIRRTKRQRMSYKQIVQILI